jgi:hypothetical protein
MAASNVNLDATIQASIAGSETYLRAQGDKKVFQGPCVLGSNEALVTQKTNSLTYPKLHFP